MNIIVKPVKCGDCSILCGDTQQLLIDCGSDNCDYGLSSSEFAVNAIQDEISKNRITDILISHFHKDHFNGILEIPNTYRLRTAYLPYSIIDGEIIYLKGIGRLLSIAPDKSWGFRLSRYILELFEKIEIISDEIRFLKMDAEMGIDGHKFHVIWPEIKSTTGFSYGNLAVKQTYNELNRFVFTRQSEFFDSLSNTEHKLAEQFNEIVGTDHSDLVNALEDFLKCFDEYLRNLHEGSNEYSKANYAHVKETYSILNSKRELFRSSLGDQQLNDITNFSRQQYHSLVTSMNAISVVFDYKDRFIFLGDVPVDVIDHIKPSFEKQYEFVKIQHHGTDRYYSDRTPKGTYSLISNGGYESRKVSADYIGSRKILCTNAHNDPQRFCNYYADNEICSSECIQVGASYQVNL